MNKKAFAKDQNAPKKICVPKTTWFNLGTVKWIFSNWWKTNNTSILWIKDYNNWYFLSLTLGWLGSIPFMSFMPLPGPPYCKGRKKGEKLRKLEASFLFLEGKLGLLKGQLISKCPFGFIVWTKIPTKLFLDFCPEFFCSFLGASWKLFGLPGDLVCNIINKEACRKPQKVSRKPPGRYKNFRAEIQK